MSAQISSSLKAELDTYMVREQQTDGGRTVHLVGSFAPPFQVARRIRRWVWSTRGKSVIGLSHTL